MKKVAKLKKSWKRCENTWCAEWARSVLVSWAKHWWIVGLKEDTTQRHKKLHKQNYTARLQPQKGSYGHIRPAPWQHARHSPGTPHACHRWRRLGFSRQLAHGRHHTCTILDCYNPTSWKIAKSWKNEKNEKIFKKKKVEKKSRKK